MKKLSDTPAGNHIFKLTKGELPLFNDCGYLEKKLINYFKAWNKQE
jgi:hypothetical protein